MRRALDSSAVYGEVCNLTRGFPFTTTEMARKRTGPTERLSSLVHEE
jgi:hypothetical protein